MEHNVEERKLVQACIDGDHQAQSKLYYQYSNAMYNICYRMMKSSAHAEDILQDAFITVYEKLASFRFDASLGAWIKRIVINKCINALREQNKMLFEHLDPITVPNTDHSIGPEPPYTIHHIKQAVKHLPPGYQIITNLYLFEGYDHGEIAQILKISESTSKSQYHRAKKRIIKWIYNQKT